MNNAQKSKIEELFAHIINTDKDVRKVNNTIPFRS